MDDELKAVIRGAGGIVHSDGNIFFTNSAQFMNAAHASTELILPPEMSAEAIRRFIEKHGRAA